jgi:predicted transcriptional regulator of viral defense system
MARQLSPPFFSATPVFDRAQYAQAVGREIGDKIVTSMLSQHLKAGNIRRIARGVFASVPKHADPATWSVDRFLAASRLRQGGVIGYHSALQLHGYAYSEGFDLQVIASGQPALLETADFSCRFVKAPAPLADSDITTVDRLGQTIRVTTLECTTADLFDRPDLAGGPEELVNSLDLISRLDARQVLSRLGALGNATAAGAAGWWLEANQERLGVADSILADLHALAPRQNRYALGARPGAGKVASGWRVILPKAILSPSFEGQPWTCPHVDTSTPAP